jgi:UDP-N-acetylglucosamine--N-acetylmuramyl-(pentapeptide) pyrophosphoryl-undecaprenol N-acetylglucosamine transferase
MKYIIAGGGTGGHVFPAIAIAHAIQQHDSAASILFVGAQGKLEMEKVPKAGFPIEGLWISGFQRALTLQNLLFPFKLAHSLWRCIGILRRFRPHAVVGVGGFASGPLTEVAYRMGIPILIQEQNSYAGITNKLMARKAQRFCVAYEGLDRFFPKDNIVLTGNPVRGDLLQLSSLRNAAIQHFQLNPALKTILVLGGSLGARTLNESMEQAATLLANEPIQVLWQVGRLYENEFRQKNAAQLPHIHLLPFIERMDYAYAAADVVVSRAGALSISELCIAAKPCILVPSPNVAEDHQTKNAQALVSKQAALLVTDADARTSLVATALELVRNEQRCTELAKQIKLLAKPNAANDIALEVIALAKMNDPQTA